MWLQVADLRDLLDRDVSSASPASVDANHVDAPLLLGGLLVTPHIQEILLAIPPRSIVDRLVARYFHSTESSLSMYRSLEWANTGGHCALTQPK
jgi:hypothetical protein